MSGDILCINLFFQSLMKYLQDESLDKRKIPFETSGWQTENVQVCHIVILNIQCSVPFIKSLTWVMTGGSDKTVLGVCSLSLASHGCLEAIRAR